MSEMGPEAKIGFIQRVKESFSPRAAKEKWYREHMETVKKYEDVQNGLTDQQRAEAMAKLEAEATKSARINVGKNWGALALASATVGGGVLAVIKPGVVDDLAAKLKKVDIKGHNFGLGKAGEALSTAANKSHDFVWDIPGKAAELSQAARDQLVRSGQAVREAVAKVKIPFRK